MRRSRRSWYVWSFHLFFVLYLFLLRPTSYRWKASWSKKMTGSKALSAPNHHTKKKLVNWKRYGSTKSLYSQIQWLLSIGTQARSGERGEDRRTGSQGWKRGCSRSTCLPNTNAVYIKKFHCVDAQWEAWRFKSGRWHCYHEYLPTLTSLTC